jgi:hypothetical protein
MIRNGWIDLATFDELETYLLSNFEPKTEKYTGSECICAVCIDSIENGSDIYRLSCNHIFHAHNCLGDKGIINWIEDNKTCPYCRAKIDTQEENKFNPDYIEIVMQQANVSKDLAINALKKHKGDLVEAILECVF